MSEQNKESTFAQEIAALKQQFEGIKTETEDFIGRAKTLSDQGIDEAKEVLEAAKDNWNGIVSAFEGSKIAKFFSKKKVSKVKAKVKKLVKKATSKKPAAKKKPVAKKKTSKVAAKKKK